MGLIAGTDQIPEGGGQPNNPPTWFRVPTPAFSDSTAGDYDLDGDTNDVDDDPLTYTHDGTSTALPTGVSIIANNLHATTSVSGGTTTGVRIFADDGVNNPEPSPNFDIVVSGNSSPTWTGTPNPLYSAGTQGDYNLDNDTNDIDGDPLTYTHDVTSTALPTGISIVGNQLHASVSVVEGITNGVRLKVNDGVNTAVPSSNFTITVDAEFVLADQKLRDAGYLLVDDFGADPTGTNDSIVGINNCITQARADVKPVWFSKGATYLVSDTVRCFKWDKDTGSSFSPTHTPELFGGGKEVNGTRPVIKLIDGAAKMQNANDARPVVVYRMFQLSGDGVEPTDVLDDTGIFRSQANNLFYMTFQNINIDCGNNPGAFGIYAPTAQRSFAADVTIDCSQAAGGWWGLLGRNGTITNVKIIGGVEQLVGDIAIQADGNAGIILTGVTLLPDSRTITPFKFDDFNPCALVGFKFESNGFTGDWVQIQSTGGTGYGNLSLIDGIVVGGSRVIDNAAGKNFYARNIYANNVTTLIQSGSQAVITGSGTWKRIAEYAYTDQNPTENASAGNYLNEAIVNGSKTSTPEPISIIENSVTAPTRDFVSDHIVDWNRITDAPYEDITDHGAVSGPELFASRAYDNNLNYDTSTADSLAAINSAISAATTAGHDRVFVPRGFFYVSAQVDLAADTKIFGCSATLSKIGVKSSWQPTSKVYVVRTANTTTGTCQWSELAISSRSIDPALTNDPTNVAPAFDWFSWIHWRTGKLSSSQQRVTEKQFPGQAQNTTNPHDYAFFDGNGGGRHYSFTDMGGRGYNDPLSIGVRIENTTQPLQIYGYNPEMAKGGPQATSTTPYCSIITGATNVRIYGTKREGSGGTMLCTSVNNFAHFGSGREEPGAGTTDGITCGHHVKGTSDKFLFSCIVQDISDWSGGANQYMTYEDTTAETAVGILYPNGCSVHKRGELDDAAMYVDGGPATPDSVITSITLNMGSLLNTTPGNSIAAEESDNWPITWAWDNHQYTAFGDGKGFHNLSGDAETRASIGVTRIEGSVAGYSAFDVFKSGKLVGGLNGKCQGMLGANAKLYMCWDYRLGSGNDGTGSRDDAYEASTICGSTNAGVSWTEIIRWNSSDWGVGNLDGFFAPTFLQFGQDNGNPRDTYVYVYLMEHDNNDYEVQTPGGITLMRCLESNLDSGNKSHWSFLSNLTVDNVPSWSTNLANRIMIFQDVADGNHVSTVSYNEPLDRYILTTFHKTRVVPGAFIGFYDAPEPWGPWHTIKKQNVTAFGPNLAVGDAVILWNFSNKWLSSSGLDFVLVGTLDGDDEWGTVEGSFTFGPP